LIRAWRIVALGLLLSIVLAACGRSSTSQGPSLATVYAGRVGLSDLSSAMDVGGWVEGPPTFGVRPLNSASIPDVEKFNLTLQFSRVGTMEGIRVEYHVWNATTFATNLMAAEQTSLGTSLSGPKAGDQVLYYNQNLGSGPAPYSSEALVRVGQTMMAIGWNRVSSFIDTKILGKFAQAAAKHLKDSLAGKTRPSPVPQPDPLLLAPQGPDLTMLGTTVLPVGVVGQLLVSPAPDVLTGFLQSAGAKDVLFGDYALNQDTRMEVVTIGMTFTNPTDVPRWITGFFNSSGIQQGTYLDYEQDTGQYVAAFGQGNRAIMVVCKSSQAGEQAGRSCEGPLLRVVNGWRLALVNG
jgi:hypothetical protein